MSEEDLGQSLIQDIEREGSTTRRMLERVPEDKFAWKPHPKSMTLGRLATHLAELAGMGARVCNTPEQVIDPATYRPAVAATAAEVLSLFDRNLAATVSALRSQAPDRMREPWRLKRLDEVLFELPRAAVVRTMMLSHIVHHRGQLSVYLRLLDVPLPMVYGPTADQAR